MTGADKLFHEAWLGMVQPAEGLVVSQTVLLRAQCNERRAKSVQLRFRELCTGDEAELRVRSLSELLEQLLLLPAELFDVAPALPPGLSLYVPEGKQKLAPTLALRRENVPAWSVTPANDVAGGASEAAPDSTPATTAGSRYLLLAWDVPAVPDLDEPETHTGPWLESV